MALINGTSISDTLIGTDIGDTISGFGGDDILAGSGGDDTIDGGFGDDILGLSKMTSLIVTWITNEAGNDSINGGQGNDFIVAGPGNDDVRGDEGDDTIFGDDNGPGSTLAGDDRINGGAGSDYMAGGAGFDIAYFDLPHRAYTIVPDTTFNFPGRYPSLVATPMTGTVVTTGSGAAIETDRLIEIEQLEFVDGRNVTNPNDPISQTYRVFKAGLNRAPDPIGLNFWGAQVAAGEPIASFANFVAQSPEFQAHYGALDNTAFVQQLYQNVLARPGEAAGVNAWVNALNTGSTRGDVLVGFANSAENLGNTAGVVAAGIWDQDEKSAQVARLYDTAFNRLPDLNGFLSNRAALGAGQTLEQLVHSYAQSPEFAALYGGPDPAPVTLVNTLYVNTLNRPADAGGLDYWTQQIQSGAQTPDHVIASFSESMEHQTLSLPSIEGGIVFA